MPLDIEEMDEDTRVTDIDADLDLSSFELPSDALHEPDPEIIAEDDVSGDK